MHYLCMTIITDALPSVFQGFFKPIHNIHRYNTRLASKDTYYTFKIRTNYGKFNIRFSGAKVWNSIQENLKSEKRNQFKKILKKISLAPIQMHEAFCCPVLPFMCMCLCLCLCLCFFLVFFVLPCSCFFFY